MANTTVEKVYIFYKISCFNPNITDCYIGSTTDFVKRKYTHRCMCKNKKYNNWLNKLYVVMNENGGWANWAMNIIDKKKCSLIDARIHETKLMDQHNSTLNKNRAFITEEQRTENIKKWKLDNKEYLEQKYKLDTEKRKAYMVKWRQKNQDKVKQYYETQKKKKQNDSLVNQCNSEDLTLDSPLVQDAPECSLEHHPAFLSL